MSELPGDTLTVLHTEIEGSTWGMSRERQLGKACESAGQQAA
jgi:hypothetical protein